MLSINGKDTTSFAPKNIIQIVKSMPFPLTVVFNTRQSVIRAAEKAATEKAVTEKAFAEKAAADKVVMADKVAGAKAIAVKALEDQSKLEEHKGGVGKLYDDVDRKETVPNSRVILMSVALME